MPSTISNATRHRIVAEAVVSAYIHEIAQPSRPARPHERGGLRADFAAAPGAIESAPVRARPLGRARGQALALRRRQALELRA
jgi:hypothetical protein